MWFNHLILGVLLLVTIYPQDSNSLATNLLHDSEPEPFLTTYKPQDSSNVSESVTTPSDQSISDITPASTSETTTPFSDFVYTGCGKSSFSNGLQDRILGGENATQQNWPWHVQLASVWTIPATKSVPEFRYYDYPGCGASLINKNWVLTAAHCVYRYGSSRQPPFVLHLVFGDREDPNATVERSAKNIIVHPFYEHVISQAKFDLALVLLNESVRFTSDLLPICLPEVDLDLTGHTAYLTGRGLFRNGDGNISSPVTLQAAKMEIFHNSECLEMLSNDEGCPHCKRLLKTSENIFCAGLQDGSVSAAHGDSGGPLVVRQFYGTWTQVGVVSTGHPEYKFGIFTKVAKHLRWIEQVMRTHSPPEEDDDEDQ